MSKVFRNIYYLKDIFTKGKGTHDILYYGNLYSNAKMIKDFNKVFDRNIDILISCDKCAKNKYGKIIKVKRP